MKIADNRHAGLEPRTAAWMLHIQCDCGVTFGWEPKKGNVVTCSCGKRTEQIDGADVSPIPMPQ